MKRFFNENHNRFTVNMNKEHSHNSDTSAQKILISLRELLKQKFFDLSDLQGNAWA